MAAFMPVPSFSNGSFVIDFEIRKLMFPLVFEERSHGHIEGHSRAHIIFLRAVQLQCEAFRGGHCTRRDHH